MPLNLEFLRDRNHNGSKFAEIAVDLMNPVIAGHAGQLADSNGQGSVRRRVTVARWVEQETLDVRLGGALLGDKRSSTDDSRGCVVRRRVSACPLFFTSDSYDRFAESGRKILSRTLNLLTCCHESRDPKFGTSPRVGSPEKRFRLPPSIFDGRLLL